MRNNSSSWLITHRMMIDEYCNLNLPVDYDIHLVIAYGSLAFLGLFYALLGNEYTLFLNIEKEQLVF